MGHMQPIIHWAGKMLIWIELFIMFVKVKGILPTTNFRNLIGILSWPVELLLLIFCRILLTSLCVVGCIVKESSSLWNEVSSSLLLLVLLVSFFARVLLYSLRSLGSTFILLGLGFKIRLIVPHISFEFLDNKPVA